MTRSKENDVRDMFEAYLQGDHDRFVRAWHEDGAFHIPGHNAVAGVYTGRDGLVDFQHKRDQILAGKAYSIQIENTSVSDDHVALMTSVDAMRDGRPYTWQATWVFFFREGCIGAGWLFVDDLDTFDAFWQ
jgi:ketosteroid isomerase-like protein